MKLFKVCRRGTIQVILYRLFSYIPDFCHIEIPYSISYSFLRIFRYWAPIFTIYTCFCPAETEEKA